MSRGREPSADSDGATSEHDCPKERRRAPRFAVRAPVEFEDTAAGQGTTENISTSGVLIEETTSRLNVGADLTLRFSFGMGSFETPFRGSVVRHTPAGFAVHFSEVGSAQLEVLGRALPWGAT